MAGQGSIYDGKSRGFFTVFHEVQHFIYLVCKEQNRTFKIERIAYVFNLISKIL